MPAGGPHLLFGLGAFTLALPLEHVVKVERPRSVTSIPLAAPWLRGVTAVDGEVVSVVDLGRFSGGSPAGTTPGARLVVARCQNVTAGLLVDRTGSVVDAPASLSPAPVGHGPLSAYWAGAFTTGGEVALVLDTARIFQSAEFFSTQLAVAQTAA